MKRGVLTLTLSAALLSTACVSSENENSAVSIAGDDWVNLEKTEPEALYAAKCGMCHRDNGMGSFILSRRMAPDKVWLEHRDDLQPTFVKTVVRNGFALMFPMSRGEVSDEQLDIIADYLAQEE